MFLFNRKKERGTVFIFFGGSHLPDAPRPSALRATWPCFRRALQMTCTQLSACRRHYCHLIWPKPRLLRRCSRARPRGVRCTAAPGGRRPRSPPWRQQGDQSRRRAIWGPFSRALVESTLSKGADAGHQKGNVGRAMCFLTSLRSSFVGMLHRSDLSSRPGRRRAESIRSGRLGITRIVNGCQRGQGINTPLPSSGKDINPIETLRTIHQCQELVDNPISNSSTVMSTCFFKKDLDQNRRQGAG